MEHSVRFGRYRFDPTTGRLWSGRKEIRLTPKAASVLDALVTNAGQLVTREALFASVWEGAAVSEDALTSCVQELRRALMDDAKHPRFIETRHRRGYRFVAAVEPAAPEDTADGPSPAPEVPSIAVLPFTDMSPGRDQDYLCEGLAEELTDALTHVEGLRVAARSSSFQFRGSGADVRDVGHQLGVATLLEGSVRKTGDRLRITVQLVEAATGYHRWSQRFDRTLDDVFAIQEEIAENVATSLRGFLTPKERKALRRPGTAARTYEVYLRGRQHLHRLGQADLQRSGDLFEKAIALDPDYAPAWAGLAETHAILFEWCGARPEHLQGADRASRRALELAPDLAEAHVARGSLFPSPGATARWRRSSRRPFASIPTSSTPTTTTRAPVSRAARWPGPRSSSGKPRTCGSKTFKARFFSGRRSGCWDASRKRTMRSRKASTGPGERWR
jgi:TolB-like protein